MTREPLLHARRPSLVADVMLENRKLRRILRNAEHVADKNDRRTLALIAIAILVMLAWGLVR